MKALYMTNLKAIEKSLNMDYEWFMIIEDIHSINNLIYNKIINFLKNIKDTDFIYLDNRFKKKEYKYTLPYVFNNKIKNTLISELIPISYKLSNFIHGNNNLWNLLLDKYIKNKNRFEILDLINAREKYDRMYPILKLDFLNKFIKENISNHDFEYIKNLFEIKKIYNKRDERNCISLCLFCQNVDNISKPNKNKQDWKDKNSNWYFKYFKTFLKFIDDFKLSNIYNKFKLRLYLENQMIDLIPNLLKRSNNKIEIYLMTSNSIDHNLVCYGVF